MPDCEHAHTVHVAVYDQWYCTDCNSYMPRGWLPERIQCPYGDHTDTMYVERYRRYFCNICKVYLPEGYGPPRNEPQEEGYSGGGPATQDPPKDNCLYCGGPILLISDREQYRCENCVSYMPKGYGNPDPGAPTYTDKCPYCGGTNIVEIERYHQYFCQDCNTYLPKGTVYQPPGGGAAPIEHFDLTAGPTTFDNTMTVSLNGCQRTIHIGPLVYVKKYQQYYCEHCNYFVNIGWEPSTPTIPPE